MKCIGWKLYLINDYVKRQSTAGSWIQRDLNKAFEQKLYPEGLNGVSEP